MIVAKPVTGTRVTQGRGVRTEIQPLPEDELEPSDMAASAHDRRMADLLQIASAMGVRWSELREVRVRDFAFVPHGAAAEKSAGARRRASGALRPAARCGRAGRGVGADGSVRLHAALARGDDGVGHEVRVPSRLRPAADPSEGYAL